MDRRNRKKPCIPTRGKLGLFSFLAVIAVLALYPQRLVRADDVVVFAAASTADAMTAIAEIFEAENQIGVTTVFAASSTIAKQISQGAPADIFLSANVQWMDYLAEQGLLLEGHRWDRLSNDLVLIAPVQAKIDLSPSGPRDTLLQVRDRLAGGKAEERIVLGDPNHVPAGIYAKAALREFEMWESLRPHAVFAGDVRRALALVERKEALFGLVYRSDARISPKVKVLANFPPMPSAPIIYPAAVIDGRGRPAVLRFFDFMSGKQAQKAFEAHGFHLMDESSWE